MVVKLQLFLKLHFLQIVLRLEEHFKTNSSVCYHDRIIVLSPLLVFYVFFIVGFTKYYLRHQNFLYNKDRQAKTSQLFWKYFEEEIVVYQNVLKGKIFNYLDSEWKDAENFCFLLLRAVLSKELIFSVYLSILTLLGLTFFACLRTKHVHVWLSYCMIGDTL